MVSRRCKRGGIGLLVSFRERGATFDALVFRPRYAVLPVFALPVIGLVLRFSVCLNTVTYSLHPVISDTRLFLYGLHTEFKRRTDGSDMPPCRNWNGDAYIHDLIFSLATPQFMEAFSLCEGLFTSQSVKLLAVSLKQPSHIVDP